MSQITVERITSLTGRVGFARLALPKLKSLLDMGAPNGARVLAIGPLMIVLRSRTHIEPTVRRPGER